MTAINRRTLVDIRKDLNTALASVGAKHGLVFNMGNIRFDSSTFRGKLTATSVSGNNGAGGANATVVDHRAAALSDYAWQLGSSFNKDHVYTIPSLGRCKVVGFNRAAHKYPFIVQPIHTGLKYKLSAKTMQNAVNAGAV